VFIEGGLLRARAQGFSIQRDLGALGIGRSARQDEGAKTYSGALPVAFFGALRFQSVFFLLQEPVDLSCQFEESLGVLLLSC
jgi:hypothetical protein